MKISYTKKGHVLYPNINISDNYKGFNSLGKYGKLALNYLKETNPYHVVALEMTGELNELLHKIDSEANEMLCFLEQQMLESNPPKDPSNILASAKHRRSIISQAEEIVLKEIVYVPR